jgi:hypothetical protein
MSTYSESVLNPQVHRDDPVEKYLPDFLPHLMDGQAISTVLPTPLTSKPRGSHYVNWQVIFQVRVIVSFPRLLFILVNRYWTRLSTS